MKLFDTCSVLKLNASDITEKFYISFWTLRELEGIKNSKNKDEETKYKAREALRWLNNHLDMWESVPWTPEDEIFIQEKKLPDINDSRIAAAAARMNSVFVTDDLSCRTLAKSAGIDTQSFGAKETEIFRGFTEISLSDDELAFFYGTEFIHPENKYHLKVNEYLIIRNNDITIIYRYTKDNEYTEVLNMPLNSKMFGKLKPFDAYQICAIDSLSNNQVSVFRGGAGSGKSLISLAYLFQEVEKGHLDKIVIVTNPIAAKGASLFGYTPGTIIEKQLDTQIGGILSTKLGDRFGVERLIMDGVIELIPFSNLRGSSYDGKVGLYVTEAQNLDVYLLQLFLQRCGNETKVIIEGDNAQTDAEKYSGSNNGMTSCIKALSGSDLFGTIELQKCYRSRLADLASKME